MLKDNLVRANINEKLELINPDKDTNNDSLSPYILVEENALLVSLSDIYNAFIKPSDIKSYFDYLYLRFLVEYRNEWQGILLAHLKKEDRILSYGPKKTGDRFIDESTVKKERLIRSKTLWGIKKNI